MRVLFVCTGNYYRSRYAEVRLEHWSTAEGLSIAPFSIASFSRGLEIDVAQKHNKGPMSPFAVERLEARGIDPSPWLWMPQPLAESDLHAADLTVVLDAKEHRPMMRAQFPAWLDRVRFWMWRMASRPCGAIRWRRWTCIWTA